MEDWKNRLSALVAEPASVLKWLIFSGLIGLIVGCVSAAFYHAFFWATSARTTHLWLIGLLPLGGICIVALYRLCGLEKDQGTNFVLVAVRENVPLRLRTAPLVFFSTILTHLVGGSSGREGAILQIGGSISSKVGQWMKLDDKDSRIITMCGMAAAFSALFGTPITAAMFAMEVVSVGVLYYAAIVPCAVSSIMGLWVAKLFHVPATAFPLTGIPDLSPVALLQVIVLGVLFALLSILFCRIMHTVPHLYQRFFPNSFLRAAVGGFLVIALTLLVWLWNPFTFDYNGAGESIIHAAVEGTPARRPFC